MDNDAPLVLAHQNGRKAEILLAKKCYDEAVECHKKASEYIKHAMTLTKVSRALESLSLQFEFHLKQSDIIKAQKLRSLIKDNLSTLKKKKKMDRALTPPPDEPNKKNYLQNEIFTAMEEADSLLGMLTARHGSVKGPYPIEQSPPCIAGSPDDYMKHPKDDRQVIEELRTVNSQLRSLVTELVNELDTTKKEVEQLRHRLRVYTGIHELAPLDIPTFDYSVLCPPNPLS